MTNYDELRQAAEVATPGPWTNSDAKRGSTKSVWLESTAREVNEREWGSSFADRPSRYGPHRDYIANCVKLWRQPGDAKANARYISLANPQAILALLDENEALRAALIRAAETLQWVADERPTVIAFDFSEIRKALGIAP